MASTIVLLRGINVGGHHVLPMAELRADLTALGLDNVRTYIQSGNAVFDDPRARGEALADAIGARIEQRHGFRPHAFVLPRDGLRAAVEGNPFPEAEARMLQLYFLAEPARAPDLAALDAARSDTERYALTERVFYLHAPDGIGRSRLAAHVDRHLGVTTTARNLRTARKLLSLAFEPAG